MSEEKNNTEVVKYEDSYNDDSFWNKVKDFAKTAGENVLEPAIKLYYVFQDEDTPAWAKTTILGALGYFISPIDAIPDVTPAVGFADDLGVLAAAVTAVASHIKEEHTNKAKEALKLWFS